MVERTECVSKVLFKQAESQCIRLAIPTIITVMVSYREISGEWSKTGFGKRSTGTDQIRRHCFCKSFPVADRGTGTGDECTAIVVSVQRFGAYVEGIGPGNPAGMCQRVCGIWKITLERQRGIVQTDRHCQRNLCEHSFWPPCGEWNIFMRHFPKWKPWNALCVSLTSVILL